MVMMEPRNLFFMALTLIPDPNEALVTYKNTNNTFLMKTRKTGSDEKKIEGDDSVIDDDLSEKKWTVRTP